MEGGDGGGLGYRITPPLLSVPGAGLKKDYKIIIVLTLLSYHINDDYKETRKDPLSTMLFVRGTEGAGGTGGAGGGAWTVNNSHAFPTTLKIISLC